MHLAERDTLFIIFYLIPLFFLECLERTEHRLLVLFHTVLV